MEVFDRRVKLLQRDRSARQDKDAREDFAVLRDHIGRVLVDRVEDIKKDVPMALDLGCYTGHLYDMISEVDGLNGKGGLGGIETLIQMDSSVDALKAAQRRVSEGPAQSRVEVHHVCADEEFLPFAENTFDIVLSNLSLHWVNDLPRAMAEIRKVLKPDGVFIGSMLGGSTLTELRSCMLMAEMEREGGMSTHTSPMAHVSDCGGLLQGAGFTLPTVDTDVLTMEVPCAFTLMEHLQGMGESNAALSARSGVRRDTLLAAAAAYQAGYGKDEEGTDSVNGLVKASFQVIYMIGWSPHESQPTPKRRGSATHSLSSLGKPST